MNCNPQPNNDEANEQLPRFASADERTQLLGKLIGKLSKCILKAARHLEEGKTDKDSNGPTEHYQDQ